MKTDGVCELPNTVTQLILLALLLSKVLQLLTEFLYIDAKAVCSIDVETSSSGWCSFYNLSQLSSQLKRLVQYVQPPVKLALANISTVGEGKHRLKAFAFFYQLIVGLRKNIKLYISFTILLYYLLTYTVINLTCLMMVYYMLSWGSPDNR